MKFLSKIKVMADKGLGEIDQNLSTVKKFIEDVVNEQKEHGEHGDQTYIQEGEKALEAIEGIKENLKWVLDRAKKQ